MENKLSLKQVALFAKAEYVQWITSSKQLVMIIMFGFIYSTIIEPVCDTASKAGKTFTILEPFTALANSGAVMLILPLVFIVLMSDFPRVHSGDWYWTFRIGRVNWFLGQMLFGLMSVVSYIVEIIILTIIPVAIRASWKLEWSDLVFDYVKDNPDQAESFFRTLFPENLFNQMSLLTAVLLTAVLLMAYLFLLLEILMVARLWNKRFLGIIGVGMLVGVGTVLCSFNNQMMWMFPMANSVVWIHYTKYFRVEVFPLMASVVYFAFFIIMFTMLSLTQVKEYQFSSQEV